ASARWEDPARFAPPVSLDVFGPQLGFSARGTAAVAFSVQDSDAPSASTAYATWRAAGGRISKPLQIPGAQEALDVAVSGQSAELLTGDSETGQSCCSSASVVQLSSHGTFRSRQTLVGTLA